MKEELNNNRNYRDGKCASDRNDQYQENHSKPRQASVPQDNVIYEHIIPPAVRKKWIRQTSVDKDENLSQLVGHQKVTRSYSSEALRKSDIQLDPHRCSTPEGEFGDSIVSHDVQNSLGESRFVNSEETEEALSPRNKSETVSEEEEVTHAAFTWGVKLRHVELKLDTSGSKSVSSKPKRPVSMPVFTNNFLNEISGLKAQEKVAPPKSYKSPHAKVTWKRPVPPKGNSHDNGLKVSAPQSHHLSNSQIKRKDASPEPESNKVNVVSLHQSPLESHKFKSDDHIAKISLAMSPQRETLSLEMHDNDTPTISKSTYDSSVNDDRTPCELKLISNSHQNNIKTSNVHIQSEEKQQTHEGDNISMKDALRFFSERSKSSNRSNTNSYLGSSRLKKGPLIQKNDQSNCTQKSQRDSEIQNSNLVQTELHLISIPNQQVSQLTNSMDDLNQSTVVGENQNSSVAVQAECALNSVSSKQLKTVPDYLSSKPSCDIATDSGRNSHSDSSSSSIMQNDHSSVLSEKHDKKIDMEVDTTRPSQNGVTKPNTPSENFHTSHSPDIQFIIARAKKRKVGSLTIQSGDTRDKEISLLQSKNRQPNTKDKKEQPQVNICYSSDANKKKQSYHKDIPITSIDDVPVSNIDKTRVSSNVPVTSIDDIPISSIDITEPSDQASLISLKFSTDNKFSTDTDSDDDSGDENVETDAKSELTPPAVVFDHPVTGLKPILSPERSKRKNRNVSTVTNFFH